MTSSQRTLARTALGVATWLALLGCGRAESPPPPAVAAAAAPAGAEDAVLDGHIDPTPYRAEIQAAEALLYSDDAPGGAGWKHLSSALLELHNAIVFHDTSPAARETSRRLFFFSAQVDAGGSPKHVEEELATMRGTWEKIRAERFAQADWFHTTTR